MSPHKRTSASIALPPDHSGESHRDAGFSLIEVLVSLSLFTIVAASSIVALVMSAKYAESSDNRVVAAGIATAQIALARAATDQVALSGGTATITQNGATFTVEREVARTCAVDHKRVITITVSWVGIGAPVQSDTVRSC